MTRPDLTPTQIAEKCYDCKSNAVARSIASINLRKLNVSRAEVLERMGLTDEVDVSDLIRLRQAKKIQSCNLIVKRDSSGNLVVNENSNDFIEVDDNQTQLKALELTYKVKGAFNEVVGPSDTVLNFLTIIEQINAVSIAGPGKGITVDEGPNLTRYRDK
jgi:Fe-S-cluster-containing hydrogenase component 2